MSVTSNIGKGQHILGDKKVRTYILAALNTACSESTNYGLSLPQLPILSQPPSPLWRIGVNNLDVIILT